MKQPATTVAVAGIVVWTTAAFAVEGRADGAAEFSRPEQARKTEIGISVLAAYGAGEAFEDNAVNRYGFGLGARAGVTLRALPLYLGLSFIRFLGGKDGSGEFYTSTLDAEAGYDFRLLEDLLLIRPELSLGVVQAATIQPDNAGYPIGVHWAPGLLVGMRLAPLLVSVEVRRDMVVDQWPDSVTFIGGIGAVL